MSFQRVVVRKKKFIQGIQVDAILNESYSSTVKTTKNPVEYGADIADHAILEPKKLSLTIAVSDNPVGLAAYGEIVDSVSSALGSSTQDHQHRSVTVYKKFKELMETRELVEVETRFDTFSSMLITGLSFSRDKDTSKMLLLNMTLEELRVINTESIIVDSNRFDVGQFNDTNIAAKTTSGADSGNASPTALSPEKNVSIAKQLKDALGY